ncbi:ESSS subunit of NADH:ubiquinone oxidoreductase, partial [Dissophora ornata]
PLAPGTKRVKEDWENLFFFGMVGSMVFGAALVYYKPDTNVQSWAMKEAKARMESRGETIEYKPKEQQ